MITLGYSTLQRAVKRVCTLIDRGVSVSLNTNSWTTVFAIFLVFLRNSVGNKHTASDVFKVVGDCDVPIAADEKIHLS